MILFIIKEAVRRLEITEWINMCKHVHTLRFLACGLVYLESKPQGQVWEGQRTGRPWAFAGHLVWPKDKFQVRNLASKTRS